MENMSYERGEVRKIAEREEPSNKKQLCRNCGAPIEDDFSECPKCGYDNFELSNPSPFFYCRRMCDLPHPYSAERPTIYLHRFYSTGEWLACDFTLYLLPTSQVSPSSSSSLCFSSTKFTDTYFYLPHIYTTRMKLVVELACSLS